MDLMSGYRLSIQEKLGSVVEVEGCHCCSECTITFVDANGDILDSRNFDSEGDAENYLTGYADALVMARRLGMLTQGRMGAV